jgi:transcriptional regulator with XRE-family HTH domain
MGFGTVLKTMREKAELSQSALAERAGLSLRSIQNWEQGHRVPRAQSLLALARGVGVSLEQLLAGIDPDEPPVKQKPPKPARKPKGK